MAIGWIIFGFVAVVTAILGVFVYTKKRGTIRASIGRAAKSTRKKLFRKNVRESKTAITHARKRKAQTPRGRLKAKRRAQPPGLVVRHVRKPDDPRVPVRVGRKVKAGTVKAAGTARDRYRVHRENRRAAKTETKAIATGPKKLFASEVASYSGRRDPRHVAEMKSSGLCGAPTRDGGSCMNPRMIGKDRCYLRSHGGPGRAA